MTVLPGADPEGAIRLRRLELSLDPDQEPMVVEPRKGGVLVPRRDLRWHDEAPGTMPIFPGPNIWLPPGKLGEPLLLYGERWPETWEEAYRLAGTSGDGVYLGDHPDDGVRAIRATAGMIETRGFGAEWEQVGTIEES
jgi:hypothetical protein